MTTPERSGPYGAGCWGCAEVIEAEDLKDLSEAFLRHVRTSDHDLPYPDHAIRNTIEQMQTMTGESARVDALGEVAIHPVTEDRIEDWLSFFERDAFVTAPHLAQCYCLAPHRGDAGGDGHWTERRAEMVARLRSGDSFGYLAYVGGRVAGWINASPRSSYIRAFTGGTNAPAEGEVIGVSCFVIAPPYRRHGLADRLLDHAIADAGARGAAWIEGYPSNDGNWERCRGFRPMFERRDFTLVEQRDRDRVVRRPVALKPSDR